jgi:hypothetical protein
MPPNVPERGDRVQLRGRPQFVGTLRKYDPDSQWATVEWDEEGGPETCHRFELERRKVAHDANHYAEKARLLEELFEFLPDMFHEDKVKARIAEFKRKAEGEK